MAWAQGDAEETRFAPDSLLEEDGFELPVPQEERRFKTAPFDLLALTLPRKRPTSPVRGNRSQILDLDREQRREVVDLHDVNRR